MKIVLDVNPGDVAINRKIVPAHDRQGRPTGRLCNSKRYTAGVDEMILQIRQACVHYNWRTRMRPSRCLVYIMTYWRGPNGDADSTCKAVLDALAHGGAVENDRQLKPSADCRHNSRPARIEVEIVDCAGDEDDGDD